MKIFSKLISLLGKGSKVLLLVLILSLSSIYISDYLIKSKTQGYTYDNLSDIPSNKVGLVLGTSKYTIQGLPNLFYQYRIQAITDLYNSGKIEFILISGDNGTSDYDEPTTIKRDLLELGIAEDKIFLDYAGFRTLDSIVRAKEIFSQESFTVVSQEFHNQRAIFIAQSKGLDVIGYNASDVNKLYSTKVLIREKFARIKTIYDLIFGINPKFLGEKVKIE